MVTVHLFGVRTQVNLWREDDRATLEKELDTTTIFFSGIIMVRSQNQFVLFDIKSCYHQSRANHLVKG